MHELLIRAIRERRLLMFAYRDTVRVVEPHRFGEAANGSRLLNAWLRPGHSRTTPEGGWRNFALADIEHPLLLDETFAGPREGYSPHDPRFASIFAELSATPADARAAAPADTASHVHDPPNAVHIDPNPPRKDEIGA
jgi:predicted DNA-binding transcriptional regulator YafY